MSAKKHDDHAFSLLSMIKGHAEYCQAMNCYYGIGPRKDPVEAASHFQSAALLGHPDAQSCLGWLYLHGDSVPRYSREAFRWFREAATQGSADGMCRLGLMYAGGEHVGQDWDEAEKLFCDAAQKNHAESMYYLGLIYLLKINGKNDDQLGADWMQKSADAGFADAAYTIGCMYRDGRVKKRSTVDAICWLEKAAAGKQMDAALALAALYEKPGEFENQKRSRQMYIAAASLGDDEAISRVAQFYMNTGSNDISSIYSLLFPALHKAAERGHPEAAFVMGCFWKEFDETQAKTYFNVAARMGNKKADLKLKWLVPPKKALSVFEIRREAFQRAVDGPGPDHWQQAFSAIANLKETESGKNTESITAEAQRKERAGQRTHSSQTDGEPSSPKLAEDGSHPIVEASQTNATPVSNIGPEDLSKKAVPPASKSDDLSALAKDPVRKASLVSRMFSVRPLANRAQAASIKWLLAVRNHRDADLLFRLAMAYYENPNRSDDDLVSAYHYFVKSAELGNAEAAFRLGLMYRKGEGTGADSEKATYWLERAAAQHMEKALVELRSIKNSSN